MDSDLVDLTRTKADQVLILGVVPRLVLTEVAVDAPPDVPLLQEDLALKERQLKAIAIAKLRQAHPQAQAAKVVLAASVALAVASAAALVVVSVVDSEAHSALPVLDHPQQWEI